MRILDFSDGFDSNTEPASSPFPASAVSVTPAGNLASTDVQDALEELQGNIDNINSDLSGLTASDVANVPSGNLSSTDVQAALNELQGDIDSNTSDISDIQFDYGQPNGLATLDGSGKVPVAQLPSLVIVDVYAVADIAARDALTVEEGDIAIVADAGGGVTKTYVYNGSTWLEIIADGSLAAHQIITTGIHGVTGDILGTSDAQVITNKDIDGGTASNTRRITIPKDTKSNLDALTRKEGTIVYATDTQKAYTDNGSVLVPVGSGSGSGGSFKNYITNPDAETDASGWSTYADAAGTKPVDGTGGSPNITWTRNTSSPIAGTADFLFTKDAANRQGEGVSFDMTIDEADQGKVINIRGEYKVASGTFVAGSDTTDSDLIFYAYDITNSKLVEPTPFRLFGQNGTLQGSLQPDSNCSQIRLILHVASTSALAYSLRFDNFVYSREPMVVASIASDEVDFTPTGNWVTNTTWTGSKRRVAGSMEFKARADLSGAPNSGGFFVNIPDGLSTSLPNGTAVGEVSTQDSGSGFITATAVVTSPTTIGIRGPTTALDPSGWSDVSPITFANGDYVSMDVRIPIIGWESQTQSGNQSQNRRITLKVGKSTGSQTSSASEQDITGWDAITLDTASSFDISTGVYTVPESGDYRIDGCVGFASNNVGGRYAVVQKGGVTQFYSNVTDGNSTGSLTTVVSFSGIISCVAGEQIKLKAFQSSGGSLAYVNDNAATNLNISKIQAPIVTLPVEKMNSRYKTAVGQSIPDSTITIVDYDTKDWDSHASVTTGVNWKWISPIAQKVFVKAELCFNSSAGWSTSEYSEIRIYKNGSSVSAKILWAKGNASETIQMSIADTVSVNSGDYIDIRIYQNSGGALTLVADNAYNFITIDSAGN